MPVRFGELWGAYVGPGAAGDREGRAYHLGIQSALRGDQPDADRLLSLRPDVLCTREHGVTASKVSQLDSNSPYSFILGLMSVFSCFGTGNRRFQTVCMACRRALERVPGIDMQVS